jgi:hypothetical protein
MNPKRKTTKRATETAAEAWPLLAAYVDLAERHSALLLERLEASLARARATQAEKIEAEVAETLAQVEAAILAMPAPKIFTN